MNCRVCGQEFEHDEHLRYVAFGEGYPVHTHCVKNVDISDHKFYGRLLIFVKSCGPTVRVTRRELQAALDVTEFTRNEGIIVARIMRGFGFYHTAIRLDGRSVAGYARNENPNL